MRDVDALLDGASGQLTTVRNLYEATLEKKDASPLQVLIKNILENQRSALDYMARAIVERYGKSGGKVYYPMARHPNEFPNLFERNMPGVNALRPDLRNAIKHRQPFRPGYDWLGYLSTLTNENKHKRLTPQTQMQGRKWHTGPGGGVLQVGERLLWLEGGTYVLGDSQLDFHGKPVQAYGIRETRYVDWLFADLGISVIGTLDRIHDSLPYVINDVCDIAGL